VKTVILDTSFILSAIKYRADINMGLIPLMDGPFAIIVPSPVVSELRYLAKNKGKRGIYANVGLGAMRILNPKVEQTANKMADEAVREIAEKYPDAIICTNDAKLKESLKRRGRVVYSIKGASFIGQA